MPSETRIINVKGMTCGGCVKSVHNAVKDLAGVEAVSVDLQNNQATITYDTDTADINKVAETIDDAGFETELANE